MSVKYKFLLLLLCFISFAGAGTGIAQTHAIDSLTNLLKNAPQDSSYVKNLDLLSSAYFNVGNYDSSFKYSDMALKLSRQIGYKKGEGYALFTLGWFYNTRSNYPLAL